MLKRERLDQVMNMVTEQNHISVADLAKSLQVSEMTIRRGFY
ncbi:DeoR family transcriptional regulator [Lactobacillus delbrueckii subsp. bulgaricus]